MSFIGSNPITAIFPALALSLLVSAGAACLAAPQIQPPQSSQTAIPSASTPSGAAAGSLTGSATGATASSAESSRGGDLSQKDFAEINKLIEEGSFIPARSRVEVLLSRNSQDLRLALLAGRLYRKMGLSGFALMQYEKVREHDPHMVEALVALSQLHLENLSSEIAVVFARQAVQIAPQDKEARLALVEALLAGQSLRQAQEQAQILSTMYPNDADVAHTLSGVAQAFGHYHEATALLRKALGARPQNVAWMLELASIYQAQGDYEACRSTLHQVLEIEPNSLDALNKIAHLEEFDQHEYMRALHAYRKIKEIIGDSPSAQAGMDRCLTKQSDLALNAKNAIYHLFGFSMRDAKLEEGNELHSSF